MLEPLSLLQEAVKWVWEHLVEVSIILGGILTAAGYYFSHWKAELADPDSLEELRPYLDDSPWRATYRRNLDHALDVADRFFGPPVSWRAYGVCLVIAVVYPIGLYLLTWVLGDAPSGGVNRFVPTGWPTSQRIAFLAGMALYGCVIYALVNCADQIASWVDQTMRVGMPQWAERWRKGVYAVAAILLLLLVAYMILPRVISALQPATINGARTYVLAAAIFLTGIMILVFVRYRTAYIAGTIVVAVLLVYVLKPGIATEKLQTQMGSGGSLEEGLMVEAMFVSSYLTFFLLLPLLNSAFDTASWAVSRWLGQEMLDRNFHGLGMIGFVLLDAVLALVFLCGLALLLVVGIEVFYWSAIATNVGSPPLIPDRVIRVAASEPLGDGLWITLMLFSTLVPTVIHAFVAIGSIVQLRGRSEARKNWREAADEALAEEEGLDPHLCRKIAEHWLVYRWIPSLFLLLVLVLLGWFGWQASVLPDWLLAAVEWGRSLVG